LDCCYLVLTSGLIIVDYCCATKLYSGLKLQSPSIPNFLACKLNVSAEFYGKVHKSLHCG
ncbi:hypothetical protein S83_035489, partial [Arachis hypogaea]